MSLLRGSPTVNGEVNFGFWIADFGLLRVRYLVKGENSHNKRKFAIRNPQSEIFQCPIRYPDL